MVITKCKMCSADIITIYGGKKAKQYCGSQYVKGTCANKHSKIYEKERNRIIKGYYSTTNEKKLEVYLDKLGGRSLSDVKKDELGKWFVFMWSGIIHAPVRFYLPKELQ